MRRFFTVFILLAWLTTGYSQNISGIWRGSFQAEGSIMGMANRYKFEVQLVQNDQYFTGITYSYLTTVFYGKASMKGSINPSTRKVLMEEIKLMEVRMSGGSDACLMTVFLQYSKTGNEEYLQGTYTSHNIGDSTYCGRGTVILKKVKESDFYKEPFLENFEKNQPKSPKQPNKPAPKPNNTLPKKDTVQSKVEKIEEKVDSVITPPIPEKPKDTVPEPPKPAKVLPPPPPILKIRSNELVRTFSTKERKVIIKLYDNGVIDNDTVSVYHNNRLIASNQRLSDKPITLTISIGPDDLEHEIIMVAENMGEIPPNTALMVVEMGPVRQEVHLTSTEQKNAKIIIRYEQ